MKNIKQTIKEELKEVEMPMIIDESNIKDFIYEIRDKKVMLDFDLARIYGYETKRFNEQVKRNIAKFEGDDFMFQLNETEMDNLARSQIATAQIWTIGNTGGRTSLPYAFTEQGVYMLMTVLRGPLAVKQNKIKTVKRRYLIK